MSSGTVRKAWGTNPSLGRRTPGRIWAATALPGPSGLGQVLPCWPVTLVPVSATTTMLVGSNVLLPSTNPFDVFVTTGMGRHWKVVTLPQLPGQPSTSVPPGPGAVVVLPGGALLAVDPEPWELLTPGARSWCPVRSGPELVAAQFAVPSSFTAISNDLWWETSSGSTPALTVHEVPISPCRADSPGTA